MSNIHVVAQDRHAGKRWQRYTSYRHAATDAVAHLVVSELSRACVAMPIGFIFVKGGLAPVAVQGLEPGRNLFVNDDGHWLVDYIPAAYRSYPFALGATQAGEPVLCVREDGGLLSDSSGEPFFDEQGERTSFLKEVLDFMTQVAAQRHATQRICSLLQEHKLIEPWPIKRQTESGERIVQGLYRIDKAALARLSSDALQAVKVAGALPVIYCQLLSMQHMSKLHQLARWCKANHEPEALASDGALDLEFLNNQGTVCFGQFDQDLGHERGVYS